MAQEPNIVEPCKGWNVPCAFCDKRFSKWKEPDEEMLASDDLATPGLFMLALESKLGKEVVVVGSHRGSVRVGIQQKLPVLRQQTSHKKHKESKSNILVRFMSVQTDDSKEACVVFCHWYNYGILPRLTTQWPGLTILKSTQYYQFSELCNKYCHPTKDPFWKKQKEIIAPRAVKPCKGWKAPCSFCDSRFTTWVAYEEGLEMAPPTPGLVMYSKVLNGVREIVYMMACSSLRKEIPYGHSNVEYDRYRSSPDTEPYSIEIRWLTVEDLESEDSCFVYAHWINNKVKPSVHSDTVYRGSRAEMPGEEVLLKSESFAFRQKDKQWCYEGDPSRKQGAGYSKIKDKRTVRQFIEDDLLMKN